MFAATGGVWGCGAVGGGVVDFGNSLMGAGVLACGLGFGADCAVWVGVVWVCVFAGFETWIGVCTR